MEIKKISQNIVGEFHKIKDSESQTSKKESNAISKFKDAFESNVNNEQKESIGYEVQKKSSELEAITSLASAGVAVAAAGAATATGVGAAVGGAVSAATGVGAAAGAAVVQAGIAAGAAATSAATGAAQAGIAAGASLISASAEKGISSFAEAIKKENEIQQSKSKIEEEKKAAIVNFVSSAIAAAASFGMGAAGSGAGAVAAAEGETSNDSKKLESESIESKKNSEIQLLKSRLRKLQA